MSYLSIEGGAPLHGELTIQGSKNSVLPVLAATILARDVCRIENCPRLRDVDASVAILRHLGCRVRRDGTALEVDTAPMARCDIPDELMREMRSSIIFLGAILARQGEAVLSYPGGCELGPRPVNLHLDALRALGAEVTERGGDIVCCAHDLKGRRILLPFPSVGATENAMLAACAAAGETVICNAAREPEILDLQCYLRKLGARISGAGTSTVTVSGFRPQPFVEHTIMPDRIVAATILCAGAACGGDVELQGVDPDHFLTVLDSLSEAGCAIIKTASTVRLTSTGRLTAPLTVAGALAITYLKTAHIAVHADVLDEEALRARAAAAKADGDSVGGVIRCTVSGLPAGLGGPDWRDTVEGTIARHVFAIPAVKAMLELDGYPTPTFRMDESITDFYAFTKDSFSMENYQFHPFNFEIPMAI